MTFPKNFNYFYKLHKNQKYNDSQPYWPHLLRVGLILQSTLTANKESTKINIDLITTAGYGHDSLEDTDVSKAELQDKFGPLVVKIIDGMTNYDGDNHTGDYIKKVCTASEEVRLVKLADICDNLNRMIQRPVNPLLLNKKILPIIEPMYEKIIKTKFKKYPKSAKQLISTAKLSMSTVKLLLKSLAE